MRILSFFVMSIFLLTACGADNDQLPTQLNFPASTKTLIPTQSQQLTTATLPGTIEVADSQTDNTSGDLPSSTNTPIDCNMQDDWDLYTVQRGDNLANIATRTGSTIDELTQANCLENPNRIRVGLELFVPNALDATDIPSTVASTQIAATVAPTVLVSTITAAPTITATTQAPTQLSTSSSTNMTFESDIGFGLNIPDEWYIAESATSAVENAIITSFDYTLGDEIPQNQWTDDMVSITVTVFQATTTESLSDWVQSMINQLQNANNITDVLSPVTLFTDSEIQGQSIDYISADESVVRNYYFVINDHQVQLSVGGNFDLAVPAVNSLQSINP